MQLLVALALDDFVLVDEVGVSGRMFRHSRTSLLCRNDGKSLVFPKPLAKRFEALRYPITFQTM